MQWINVEEQPVPRDGETYLALWKGQFCLTAFDEDEDAFWLQMLPGRYAGDMLLPEERVGKFTHWYKLEYPKDY